MSDSYQYWKTIKELNKKDVELIEWNKRIVNELHRLQTPPSKNTPTIKLLGSPGSIKKDPELNHI